MGLTLDVSGSQGCCCRACLGHIHLKLSTGTPFLIQDTAFFLLARVGACGVLVVGDKRWCLGLSEFSFYGRISKLVRGAINSAVFGRRPGIFLNVLIKFLKQVSSEASRAFRKAPGKEM